MESFTILIILYFVFQNQENEPKFDWSHLTILLTPHYMVVIATILFFGICNGAVWGFLYWHVENLGKYHDR